MLTLEEGALLPSGPFEGDHRRWRPACAPGSSARPARRSAMSSSSTPSATATAQPRRPGRRSVDRLSRRWCAKRGRAGARDAGWQSWYRYFPWEDWRGGRPARRARSAASAAGRRGAERGERRRAARSASTSISPTSAWNEELVLERYELLYEAGLVPEARRGRASRWPTRDCRASRWRPTTAASSPPRSRRLRGKIKYRPVVFELMPPDFTLLQLQRTVEALAGRAAAQAEFPPPGRAAGAGRGDRRRSRRDRRPAGAALRFRREVLLERAVAGTRLPLSRSAGSARRDSS